MKATPRCDLVHDLFLPTLLFAALGGMTWAVRGCSGYGAAAGCIFAGVGWGTAWWFIAQSGTGEPTRRYSSSWIILALAMGVGFSGARGWMQWPSFFEGKLVTNYAAGEWEPISRWYGFAWLFIAGMPWAGVGACVLAWCGSLRETRLQHWLLRIALGLGGAMLARYLYGAYPQYFLPLYESMADRYQDFEQNPTLRRLVNDSGLAIFHLGLYLGFLTYEVIRRDWKNVTLIATVGVVNGLGWALLQNWKWAPGFWPDANFNWWRCWESSGGISIGIAYGVAYFLVNRPLTDGERQQLLARKSIMGPNLQWLVVYLMLCGVGGLLLVQAGWWGLMYLPIAMLFGVAYYFLRKETPPSDSTWGDPTLERMGLYLGLLFGLGFSIRNGLKGWFNIYRGNEEYWSGVLWQIFGPALLVGLVAICLWSLLMPVPRDHRGPIFAQPQRWMWLVLVVLNGLALLVTGPLNQWNEFAFVIYYALLALITAVIVVYYTRANALAAVESA